MQTVPYKIDKLKEFIQRDKFSEQAWEQRGLYPSDDELCDYLSSFFNDCAAKLIQGIEKGTSAWGMKIILKSSLRKLNKFDYDTEEKEFICDLFTELAYFVQVDLRWVLSVWLYGYILTALLRIMKFLRPEKIVETRRQPCTQCKVTLETYILQKKKGIPEYDWNVVKCDQCGELNLLSHGPDAKKVQFGNYKKIEALSMDHYTYEQALVRLEQIKFFRKP